jgi:hypothetical protein
MRLRRYCGRDKNTCPLPHGYHDASVPFGQTDDPDRYGTYGANEDLKPPRSDKRWPSRCECGYIFDAEDAWQLAVDRLYKRSDTGELTSIRDAPAGAMWYADWMIHGPNSPYAGPDGHCLAVRTPGGEWLIDGRASNCTRKDDSVHKCWCRHGTVPDITVDKDGDTCAAGGGSIIANGYHGFLRGGYLEEC